LTWITTSVDKTYSPHRTGKDPLTILEGLFMPRKGV
jgi:hypothetical protein